jgi:hypothetical protein
MILFSDKQFAVQTLKRQGATLSDADGKIREDVKSIPTLPFVLLNSVGSRGLSIFIAHNNTT